MCNIIDGSKIVPNWGQSSPHESQMTLLFAAAVHCCPSPSPHGRNKGNFNSCDVMWGAIGTLHIDICYMLQLLRCCCSIVHCHYQWLYFAIIESCHNRCFISDVSSQYVTMGTVTECDTSRTNITFSAVNCPNVHCSYKHVSSPNLSSSLHKSECSASCPRIRPLVPWGEDKRAETLTSAGPDTELRYNISSPPHPLLTNWRLCMLLK